MSIAAPTDGHVLNRLCPASTLPVKAATLPVSRSPFCSEFDDAAARSGGTTSSTSGTPITLIMDLGRFLDARVPLDPNDPCLDTWTTLRRSISVLPGARRHHAATAAGIVRRGLENHAMAMRERLGIDLIVDSRLVHALDDAADGDPESGIPEGPIRMETNWGPTRSSGGGHASTWRRRIIAASIGGGVVAVAGGLLIKTESAVATAGFLAAASVPLLGRRFAPEATPANPGPDPHGSESVLVGDGWLETGSGRRRLRSNTVTTVMRQSDESARIEVRIIGADRVIRLRFESVEDPTFVAFWSRWAA